MEPVGAIEGVTPRVTPALMQLTQTLGQLTTPTIEPNSITPAGTQAAQPTVVAAPLRDSVELSVGASALRMLPAAPSTHAAVTYPQSPNAPALGAPAPDVLPAKALPMMLAPVMSRIPEAAGLMRPADQMLIGALTQLAVSKGANPGNAQDPQLSTLASFARMLIASRSPVPASIGNAPGPASSTPLPPLGGTGSPHTAPTPPTLTATPTPAASGPSIGMPPSSTPTEQTPPDTRAPATGVPRAETTQPTQPTQQTQITQPTQIGSPPRPVVTAPIVATSPSATPALPSTTATTPTGPVKASVDNVVETVPVPPAGHPARPEASTPRPMAGLEMALFGGSTTGPGSSAPRMATDVAPFERFSMSRYSTDFAAAGFGQLWWRADTPGARLAPRVDWGLAAYQQQLRQDEDDGTRERPTAPIRLSTPAFT